MPQPLSRVAPESLILIGNSGDWPINRHPELGLLAINAISSWSNVENWLLRLFVKILGGDQSMSANIFLSLGNQTAKNAAINAAAKTLLTDQEELQVFDAIIKIAKTNEKARNKLAHWTWGDTPNVPDAVLLIDPRTTLSDIDCKDVYVYKRVDFVSIIESNIELCSLILNFDQVLTSSDIDERKSKLQNLIDRPPIKEKLGR